MYCKNTVLMDASSHRPRVTNKQTIDKTMEGKCEYIVMKERLGLERFNDNTVGNDNQSPSRPTVEEENSMMVSA